MITPEHPFAKLGMQRKKLILKMRHSPASNPQVEVTPAVKMIVSYGGGMGGVHETFYVDTIPDLPTNTPITATDIRGRKLRINPRYVVYTTPVDLVHFSYNITNQVNYNAPKCQSATYHELNEVTPGTEVVIGATDEAATKIPPISRWSVIDGLRV